MRNDQHNEPEKYCNLFAPMGAQPSLLCLLLPRRGVICLSSSALNSHRIRSVLNSHETPRARFAPSVCWEAYVPPVLHCRRVACVSMKTGVSFAPGEFDRSRRRDGRSRHGGRAGAVRLGRRRGGPVVQEASVGCRSVPYRAMPCQSQGWGEEGPSPLGC